LDAEHHKSGAERGVVASGPQEAASGGVQQAMMGQVQQVIEHAKNNPNDFSSPDKAAKVFNQSDAKDENR
jgi:hypothetical protein